MYGAWQGYKKYVQRLLAEPGIDVNRFTSQGHLLATTVSFVMTQPPVIYAYLLQPRPYYSIVTHYYYNCHGPLGYHLLAAPCNCTCDHVHVTCMACGAQARAALAAVGDYCAAQQVVQLRTEYCIRTLGHVTSPRYHPLYHLVITPCRCHLGVQRASM